MHQKNKQTKTTTKELNIQPYWNGFLKVNILTFLTDHVEIKLADKAEHFT